MVAMTVSSGESTCFVVMPFREPFTGYYDSIYEPGIREAGLIPVKGDDIFAAGDVLGQIWRAIRECEIVFGELSLMNANVYYEIGLAHALKKPTVFVAQSVDLLPFDLRAGRCVPYSQIDPFWGTSLKSAITRAIKETRSDPLRSLPAGILMDSFLASPDALEEQVGNERIFQIATEIRLRQLQQSLDRLMIGTDDSTSSIPKPSSRNGTATPEELREVARRLISAGMPAQKVTKQLVDLGASELWAERIVAMEGTL
ncbi:hypothetical protein [Nonomuraea insulae]|uniref:Nucleoside 2-deoxyribosyltransferase n=1 Tax=Nonomuraea insulae TaxID=1616787 RepID=A0ABW1DBL6_9ACTN